MGAVHARNRHDLLRRNGEARRLWYGDTFREGELDSMAGAILKVCP
jgi:hypothetical protein